MKPPTRKFLRSATIGIVLLILIAVPLLCWGYVVMGRSFDSDPCLVIAMELAASRKPLSHGIVPQDKIDAIAVYISRASISVAKLTPAGPRAHFDSPFRAIVDHRGVTCYTDGWHFGWGAVSQTVPIPDDPRGYLFREDEIPTEKY